MKIEILDEMLNVKKSKVGDTFINNANITLRNGVYKGIDNLKLDDRVKGEELKDYFDNNNIKYSADSKFKTFKLLPDNKFEIVSMKNVSSSRPDVYLKLKDATPEYVFHLDIYNDAKKLYPEESGAPEKKDREEVKYALFGTPDIYGRSETRWHWSERDDYESEKDFKSAVRRTAKSCAEQEFRYYDPNSIKVKYYSSKDRFLSDCAKFGFKPDLD